jgi:hypothetical protein
MRSDDQSEEPNIMAAAPKTPFAIHRHSNLRGILAFSHKHLPEGNLRSTHGQQNLCRCRL